MPLVRLSVVNTKTPHSDLLPSRQACSTYKDALYDVAADFEVRRAVRIEARHTERHADFKKPPLWIPLEEVKDWEEPEPDVTKAAAGKKAGAA